MANSSPETKKEKWLSSVRGWLLYKSALDLWDDVNEHDHKHHSVTRTLSARQNDDAGGTLGRFSSNDLLKSTPIAVDKNPTLNNNRITVKRTKSLWKFKRSNKNEILEGMSLWKHRSLIDVRGEEGGKESKISEKSVEDKEENIYASADNILKDRHKHMEKINNEKNSRRHRSSKSESNENYYSDDTTILDDASDSVIVVNDHINLSAKRKNRSKYNVSNQSDLMSQSESMIGNTNKKEISNSRSDLSDQTETETIGKESFLPRMKVIKTNSNDVSSHFIEKDLSKKKEFRTWNSNLKVKEVKKWENGNGESDNFFKERSNNKLKDTPKLITDQLRLNDKSTKCGPWYDLWGVDASVKS